MYQTLRPLLFKLDPERIHTVTLHLVRWAGILPPTYALLRALFEVNDPRLQVAAFGVRFRNPIGLAAGYDKDGLAVRGLSALGFSHVEVGTLTRGPQAGNPRPRVHRLPEAQAVINSMGFPNQGAAALRLTRGEAKVGINIGKSKDTPVERAAEDYVALFGQVYRQADYVAINISSPNTLNLRQLQARAYIESLLKQVARARDGLTPRAPVLVKIAPDLTEPEVDDVLAAIDLAGLDGIIATNTTIAREGIPAQYRDLKGGLSGRPLTERATAMIGYIRRRTDGRLPIVGVGGVMNPADAREKLEAGATLVQVYTGLVYAGPTLVKQINQALLAARARS
jgi:dihydroorotate dehydrogenase